MDILTEYESGKLQKISTCETSSHKSSRLVVVVIVAG